MLRTESSASSLITSTTSSTVILPSSTPALSTTAADKRSWSSKVLATSCLSVSGSIIFLSSIMISETRLEGLLIKRSCIETYPKYLFMISVTNIISVCSGSLPRRLMYFNRTSTVTLDLILMVSVFINPPAVSSGNDSTLARRS